MIKSILSDWKSEAVPSPRRKINGTPEKLGGLCILYFFLLKLYFLKHKQNFNVFLCFNCSVNPISVNKNKKMLCQSYLKYLSVKIHEEPEFH